MNFRTSIILLVVLALVSGYVLLVQSGTGNEAEEKTPWFYNVDQQDIRKISITRYNDRAVFYLDNDYRWKFEDPETLPVGIDKWGGITLLLSGPKVHRTLVDQEPTDLEPYGLASPSSSVEIELTQARNVRILLGDKTPDLTNQYAQVYGYPQVFTIYSGWGDIFSRLITEPPYPHWYYNIYPSVINEILVKSSAIEFGVAKSADGWVPTGSQDITITNEDIGEILASMTKPKLQEIVEFASSDLAKYGLDTPSLTLLIKTRDLTSNDITVKVETLINIGSKAEDGISYYGFTTKADSKPDVFRISSDWVERFKDISKRLDK
jgi:hypothetical protein